MQPASPDPGPAARHLQRPSGSVLTPSWRGRTHQWAVAAAVPAGAALVAHRPDAAVVSYSIALVALFAVSASYHRRDLPAQRRRRWQRADRMTIYLFIAVASVPFYQRVAPGTFGDSVMAAVLAGAVVGAALQLRDSSRSAVAGGVLYLLTGWLAVLTVPDAVRVLGPADLALLGATGAIYTAGAVVLASRRPDPAPAVFGYHEVWHACVVAASACYFVLVWRL